MSLANYTDLQASVASFLHRADLAAAIPDFVTLAEHKIFADLNSRMQDTVTTLSTVASTETVACPADFINARSITVMGTSPNVTLDYKSPDQYQDEFPWGDSGTPAAYTIIGGNFYFAPLPDAAYTIRLVYQQRVPALSGSGTNWLMTSFPAVYLYAALSVAAAHIQDDDGLQKWEALYKAAIEGVNMQDWSSMATMRVKGDVAI